MESEADFSTSRIMERFCELDVEGKELDPVGTPLAHRMLRIDFMRT